MPEKTIEQRLAEYEGLVTATARRLDGRIEHFDLDDIRQRLRMKIWRALLRYDARASALPEQRYVFMCMTNEVKDLLKRVRRGEHLLDDLIAPAAFDDAERHEWVERTFFAVSEDAALGAVEDRFELPATLDERERRVVFLLYTGAKQKQIAAELGLRRPDVQEIERSIRSKLEDWRPSARPPHPLAGCAAELPEPAAVAA